MLSDEEKEIFNNLKEYMQSNINKGYHKFIYNDLDWDFKCIDCINAIDKVLKQSKEIEELKEKEKNLLIQLKDSEKELLEVCEKLRNSVSKDKIKAKIEEVDIQLQKLKDGLTGRKTNFVNKNMLFAQKKALQSLLEKE